MPRIPPELCTRCKGYKRLCGLPRCPILDKFRAQARVVSSISGEELQGYTPPSMLVGEQGYPRVNVYLLLPPGASMEESRLHEDPIGWSLSKTPLARIIEYRGGMVGAGLRVYARDPWMLYEKEISLAVASTRPVDTEARLKRMPLPRLRFDGLTKPLGPTAPARDVRVSGSPKLHSRLEKRIWDDTLSSEAVVDLYRSGVDVYTIQRAFSAGLFGRLRNRRLVPTRWSITAVDDIISRDLRREIRDYNIVNDTMVFHTSYLGNRFTIIVMPGEGSFEWIEAWHPAGLWTAGARTVTRFRLYEDPLGRATADDGGFSAARMAVLEWMSRNRVRGDVVILREILPSYYAPVGNWHIRETVRRAMEAGPIASSTDPGELESLISGLHKLSPREIAGDSLLLGLGRRLRRLTEFM